MTKFFAVVSNNKITKDGTGRLNIFENQKVARTMANHLIEQNGSMGITTRNVLDYIVAPVTIFPTKP